MSNETHDQNLSTETPDTAPSRMRIFVLAVVTYLVVACITYIFLYGLGVDAEFVEAVTPTADVQDGVTVAPPTTVSQVQPPITSQFAPSIYWHGSTGPLLSPDQLAFGNLAASSQLDDLEEVVAARPYIDILFIDKSRLSEGVAPYLMDQYEAGKMIVGLQIPHSELTAALGLETDLTDLGEETTGNTPYWVSIHYQTEAGAQELVQSFDQFGSMLTLVHALR